MKQTELTKREQIAAMVLQGLVSNPNTDVTMIKYRYFSEQAVKYADTLIAELEKTEKK